MELRPQDLRVDTLVRPSIQSNGQGGFGVKPETSVRVTHLPTGLCVESSDERTATGLLKTLMED